MNLARLLEGTARRIGDAPAITIGGDTWSYAELRARVHRLAGYMRARLPDAPGARVAIAMDNSPEYLLVMFAAWQAGFAIVPMNAKLHAREFAWIMENSGARMCFASPRIHAELKPETAHLEGLILIETAQGAIDKLDGKPIDVPVEVGIDDPAW
ncbi:MAG: AMP-binding protein, partial [Alphaproteobacteria bacterium]|nr:AMP-binding protein [Alphaproteobacteria bacterium]